jgi:hypothetical protein
VPAKKDRARAAKKENARRAASVTAGREPDEAAAIRADPGRPRFRLPSDFPDFGGDFDVKVVDALIIRLLAARDDLRDPLWRPRARAIVEGARRALVSFGDAVTSRERRREMLVHVLVESLALPRVEDRVMFAALTFGEALPYTKPPAEAVLRRALDLWPQEQRRTERTRALRALARALDCDAPSLMPMLRQARMRLEERQYEARRVRRAESKRK